MTTLDRYAIVFLLAFALANVTWGVRGLYEITDAERLARELVESKKSERCWEKKSREHRIGYRGREC